MKKARTVRFLILMAGAILVMATAVVAHPPRGPHGPFAEQRGFGFMDRMAERLELTEDQRETIRGIVEAHRAEAGPMHEELRAYEATVDEAVHAKVFDEHAVRAAAQQAGTARVELAVLRARIANEINAVLTPEQRESAAEMRQQRKEFRGSGRGYGRGPGRRFGARPDAGE